MLNAPSGASHEALSSSLEARPGLASLPSIPVAKSGFFPSLFAAFRSAGVGFGAPKSLRFRSTSSAIGSLGRRL